MLLFQIRRYDFILIHREAAPIGPPLIEWCIAKILRKKIIYDFDDAIWLTDNIHESIVKRIFKFRSKVSNICKWSYKVSCGNRYLADYAARFNKNVFVNPTTIDTVRVHNPTLYLSGKSSQITIGWTGSHSTLKYLEDIETVLRCIESKYPQVAILVIADKPPTMKLNNVLFSKWTHETEISDLMKADIGIMPLPDDEWAKGKCGFKALQYMALEIPCIISPVGVNKIIITDGKEGLLSATNEEWLANLEKLIVNPQLRKEMGLAGRKKVIENYSVSSNAENFLSFFA
jgi:glycosyltransferase involved in cell wall biosynthesis